MAEHAGPPLHPSVEPLAPLLGSWSGQGAGTYPTIEDFEYGEEIVVGHNGKPFLSYLQRTWALDDNRPLHGECGFWRVAGTRGPDRWAIELVLAHPGGIVEVDQGSMTRDGDELRIELVAAEVRRTATAKEVAALSRRFRLRSGELSYDLDMAAVGQPLLPHLSATLRRG